MTTQEFSNEFDILYSNISSNAAPGLNEYEKSVFLTDAQLEIVRNYFNPKGNKYQEGFDGSQKRQIDFNRLVKVALVPTVANPANYTRFDERSQLFTMPNDILYILSESAKIQYDTSYIHKINIVPITFDEYNIMISRPYKYPFKQQGWRLIENQGNNGPIAEIISKGVISNYVMRYVRMPNPIILLDLTEDVDPVDVNENFNGLTIQGQTAEQTSELDPSIHQEILQRAVELAKNAYLGDLQTTVQFGGRKE